MNWRLRAAIGGVSSLALLVPAASASAGTEVGSHCESNVAVVSGFEGILFPLVAGDTEGLPASVPSPGIATSWTARIQPGETLYERLKVLRSTPDPKRIEVVAESPSEGISRGHETFAIRIPVRAGDRFGLSGSFGALACAPASFGAVAGVTTANGAPGSSEPFYKDTANQAAVSVVVEPDADSDGYGDESQDGCPQSKALQVACPSVSTDLKSVEAKRRAVLVSIDVSSQAQVQVFGQVSWQVRQRDGSSHALLQGVSAGAPRTVAPEVLRTFRVPLGKAVSRRLGRLTRRQSLRAQMTVRTTDLAGRERDRRFTVVLHGRKPA